ncbi:MAG: leucine-rich repeat protein [Lachnospiraceae bacterium]|nr:leucine-rich repeat protein [Lachnospiraceae bacterium]
MKKRRVLALFLALSMALSSNGFTALAADQDSVAAIEAGLSEGTDETDGENTASDANDENGNNASGNEDGAQDNTGENGNASEGGNDVSEGGNMSDGNGETEGGNSSENNGGTVDDGASKESEGAGETEDDALSENDSEDGNDVDASDEADVLDDADSEKDIQIDGEGVDAANSTGVRICTFTDETGMAVTYDLNASQNYIYDVDDETDPANPVLTGISEMVNGVKQPVRLSGTIELRRPRDDEKQFNTIGAGVFKANTEIEYVILPDNVKNIESGAFSGCSKLRGIKLPSKLEKIQDSTFEGCTKLTQLSIPKGATSIGSAAFKDDSSLFMVYIKDSTYSSMLNIGSSAFEGCNKLEKFGSDTDFVLPGDLKEIGANAFKDCYAIKKVTLPDNVKEQWVDKKDPLTGEVVKDSNGESIKEKVSVGLGTGAFMNCIGLTDVTLSGVANIPKEAFSGCSNLLSVKFANGNKKIGESAFEKCIRLGEVVFSNTIDELDKKAFNGCSNLRYVEIPNSGMKEIPPNDSVFPNNNEYILWMRGHEDTEVQKYALAHNNMRFIAYKENSTEYFKYTYQCLTPNIAGTVKFFCEDKETDPNAKNGKKGVGAGATIYVSVIGSSTVKLTEGSLRCNGTPIDKDSDGVFYTFTMPVGGAYVTAEFERTGKDENQNTLGSEDDIKSELSNGNELKVGQTTRMFLIDTSPQAGGSVIAPSKIKFSTSDKTKASVSNDGTIKALKKGTVYITAEFTDNSSKSVSKEATIIIDDAEVRKLRLKPLSYDSNIIKVVSSDPAGVVLNKVNVENKDITFTILATAYDEDDDNISVGLKWSTSDSKVAKISKNSTTNAESQNTITIPKGASGEAVITATATNADPTDSQYKNISEKFIIRVQDVTPRITASTLTLNPYQEKGAMLEIIEAYGNPVDKEQVKLMKYDDKNKPSSEFILAPYKPDGVDDNDNDSVSRFAITARNTELPDGTYKANVYVKISDNPYYLPLNIKVKRSTPNPKVKLAKKQPKLNLFYRNGGVVQKDGSIAPGEVIPEISNLGDLEEGDIKYTLKNLSNSGDNAKFTENFKIDESEDGCVIVRTDKKMQLTSDGKGKPVVTGLLRLEFDGYKEGVNYRDYKITIPTKTTKPSYKLERNSDTFKFGTDTQDVYIALKEGKKIVDLTEGEWSIYKAAGEGTSSAVTINTADCISADGRIKLSVNPKAGEGKAVIVIHNEEWDEDQDIKLNYTAKISSKKTVFKLNKSSVTLNKYFSDTPATVTFKSNQYGVFAENGTQFEPPAKLSAAKKEEYEKVRFEWEDTEKQELKVSIDNTIKTGTYKFTCKPLGDDGNKVTLTVKVTGVSPTLSIKGTAKLNLRAYSADTAELTMSYKNRPANAKLKAEECVIEYVPGKGSNEDVTGDFKFEIDSENNKLRVSLSEDANLSPKTYTFKMTPSYEGYGAGENNAKSTKFKVKLYSKEISVSLKAKGKLNLLDRYDETFFDNTGVSTTASLSMAEEDNYVVVDNEAVPSFAGEEGGAEEGATENPDAAYTVTIINNSEGRATELQYNIVTGSDGAAGYQQLPADNKLMLNPNEKLSLQFKMQNMEEVDIIVVKASDGKGNDKTIKELLPTDNVADIYTVENIEINEDTTITFSRETAKKVTLKPADDPDFNQKVKAVKYAVIDDSEKVGDLTAEQFTTTENIAFSGEKYLALMFTLDKGYTVKLSIQKPAESVALAATENSNESDFDKKSVAGLGDIYLSKNKITSDMVISIQVEEAVENSNNVNFEKVGPATGGAKIMKADGTTEILTEGTSKGTDSFEKGSSYQFVIDTDNVNVEASYKDESETIHKIEVGEPLKVDSKYTYTIDTSQIDGDIDIVVTDTYGITIKKNPTDIVAAYEYCIGSNSYETYNDTAADLVAKVPYNESLSIKIPAVTGKTVLLVEKSADDSKKILDADSANSNAAETVYTISNVTAEKELTISQAYEVTDEITSTDNNTDTAAVEYINTLKNGSDSKMFVLADEALDFKVTPKTGYQLIVKYKLSAGTESSPLDATVSDGCYSYSIPANSITGDITITVTTERKSTEFNLVKFDISGATVQVEGETGNIPEGWEKQITVENPTVADRTIKFKVNVDSGKHLRYVGTDKELNANSPEITGPDNDGYYTFILSDNPDPETIIYIRTSEAGTANVEITFTGLTSVTQTQPMADIYKVEFDSDYTNNKKITTTPISGSSVTGVTGDSKFYFIVRAKDGYTLSNVSVDGATVPCEEYDVFENAATTTSKERIYKLDLQGQNVTVNLALSASGSEVSKYPYDSKSCIIYTPVVANLKDTINEAKIYDAAGRAPEYGDEESAYFNIAVGDDGLLYVMPKKDTDEAKLNSNTVYPVKIWLHFTNYDSGIIEDGGGIWVKNTIKIKTAQILPKVTASTNTINLYQSNTGYKATFILRAKENSIGAFKHEDATDENTKAIVFGEKDEKARNSLDVKTEVRGDGSLKVTVMLKNGALYAANSTNKVKMYVKFENQAENTLGTAITMNVKVNK